MDPPADPRAEARRQAQAASAPPDPAAQKKKMRIKLAAAGVVVLLFAGLGVVRMNVNRQQAAELQRANEDKARA